MHGIVHCIKERRVECPSHKKVHAGDNGGRKPEMLPHDLAEGLAYRECSINDCIDCGANRNQIVGLALVVPPNLHALERPKMPRD
jgi:hypothetical protein